MARPRRSGRSLLASAGTMLVAICCMTLSAAAQPTHDGTPPANPHIRFTQLRPANLQDQQRGQQILAALKPVMEKYADYRAAQNAGYKGYYLDVPMPMYHFASSWQGFKETMRFDPAAPTALLYRKDAGRFELIGVMYYAPGYFSEDQLNARVPLSLVRWHRQINICLPPGGAEAGSDKRFGSEGSITTENACVAAGGKWNPTLHGWMVEVYPSARTPARVWGYRPG
jgi:hypothetical protein